MNSVTVKFAKDYRCFKAGQSVIIPKSCCLVGDNATGKTTLLNAVVACILDLNGPTGWQGNNCHYFRNALSRPKNEGIAVEGLSTIGLSISHTRSSDPSTAGFADMNLFMKGLHVGAIHGSSGQNQSTYVTHLLVQVIQEKVKKPDQPVWLILDEPEVSLDATNRILVADLITRAMHVGVDVWTITHSEDIMNAYKNGVTVCPTMESMSVKTYKELCSTRASLALLDTMLRIRK